MSQFPELEPERADALNHALLHSPKAKEVGQAMWEELQPIFATYRTNRAKIEDLEISEERGFARICLYEELRRSFATHGILWTLFGLGEIEYWYQFNGRHFIFRFSDDGGPLLVVDLLPVDPVYFRTEFSVGDVLPREDFRMQFVRARFPDAVLRQTQLSQTDDLFWFERRMSEVTYGYALVVFPTPRGDRQANT